jgi:hypothetical protein
VSARLGAGRCPDRRLISTEPARAAALYEAFLAGCFAKAEEVDDSSGSLGVFAAGLFCGWAWSWQAAGSDPGQTAARLLVWMDDDPYGFCLGPEKDLAGVLDEAGLARAGAADASTVGRGRPVGGDPSQPASARRGHRATSARVSAVRHWTPCPSPRRSRLKAVSSTTQAASCGLTRARQPPRFTTTTTYAWEFSPHRWPNALTYTSLGFPDPRRSPTQAPAKPERAASLRIDSASADRIRPRRLEAQPLLNHKRQFYGSRTYTRSQWSQDADLLIPGQR